MRWLGVALVLGSIQGVLLAAAAQEQRSGLAVEANGPEDARKSAAADGKWSPALTGVRRPLYRLRTSDTLEIHFTFTPEFDQTVIVQPDGYIPLKGLPQLYAENMTVPELQQTLTSSYAGLMHDPEVTVLLKDFDPPYFIVAGQVAHPGKYGLREDLTLTEAVAVAGGFSEQAKHSQVVLFRRVSQEVVESRLINVKRMLNSRMWRRTVNSNQAT